MAFVRADHPGRGRRRSTSIVTRLPVAGLAVLLALAPVARSAEPEEALRLTLREALTLAEENAFEVKAAYHDSLAAEQGLRAAKSAWLPDVRVTGNAIGLRPVDEIAVGFLQLRPEWNSIWVTNLSLRYRIFTGGRRTNDIRRSREDVGAAASHLDATRLSHVYEYRHAYIGLLVADRRVKSAEASLQRVEAIRTDVHNLFTVGMADSVDLLDTEISLRQVQQLVERTRNERRNASSRLACLLGVSEDREIVPTEPIPEPALESVAQLSSTASSRRPELVALDHRIDAAGYQRSIAKAEYWPVVNGMGGYVLVRPDLGQPDPDWKDLWWAGLTLSWGLNLGGGEIARSSQALERMRSLEMARKDAEDAFALRTRIARNDVEEAHAIWEISRDGYSIARRRFALAEAKQAAGQMTVNRLVELEADLTETEQDFEAARLRYFAAVTDWLYAIGSDALREGM